MRRSESNRPDRRLAPAVAHTPAQLEALASGAVYVGSALHKLRPGDYGFIPSINPRPSKSVCDDLRPVALNEASRLLAEGVSAGMVSRIDPGGSPKYVWAIDGDGEVYEAKTKPPDVAYHGYRLGDDEEAMPRYIRAEWEKRCP